MYVLDAVSTRPWTGALDEQYPIQITSYGPPSVEPNTTFNIYYTVQNTSQITAWQVWGKLYQGTSNQGTLLSSFTSPTLVNPGASFNAPDTVITGGIPSTTSYYLEVGHIEGDTFTITAGAGTGGSISPSGNVTVEAGQNQTFAITPSPDYSIADVLVNGSSVGAVSSYTFYNVQSNHTIYATFTYTGGGTVTCDAGGPYTGYVGEQIQFTGSIDGATALGWYWQFGDGTTSNLQNPTHAYQNTYNGSVFLTVTYTGGSVFDSASCTVSGGPPTPPVADPGEEYIGVIGQTVQFYGSVSGGVEPYTWYWDFGDGYTSTLQNPLHTYQAQGFYTVTLTVTDANTQQSTATVPVYIAAGGLPMNWMVIGAIAAVSIVSIAFIVGRRSPRKRS